MAETWVISSKEGIKISLSKDRLSAYAEFSESISDSITMDFVMEEARNKGIVYGLIPEGIEDALRNKRFGEPILIASGKPYKRGRDASIEFYTDPPRIDYTSEEHNKERVNYREFFPIKCVNTGDLLAKKNPLIEGNPGIDVRGEPILPPPVKDVNFKPGENTEVSENGLELYATASGIPIRIDHSVKISPIYVVKGDVDYSVGNIDFLGSVRISGNVIQGFKVKATDDIIIDGIVEGAEIISGHNIVIQNGIVGGEHSRIEAKSDLNTKFINGANIKVGGVVRAVGSIIGAEVEAGIGVIAEGNKGIISGGRITAGEYVIAEILGSHMGINTKILVGYNKELFNNYLNLKRIISDAETELECLERDIKNYKQAEKKIEKLPGYLKKKYSMNLKRIEELKEQLTTDTEVVKKLSDRLEYFKIHAFVQANRKAFPDVILKIHPIVYKIDKELSCPKFVRDIKDNSIKLVPIISTEKPRSEFSNEEK